MPFQKARLLGASPCARFLPDSLGWALVTAGFPPGRLLLPGGDDRFAANRATRSKKAPTSEPKPKGTRDGSKAAQIVAMLQRNNGATLAEIMDKMGWQKHTVRGFMAGAMKKAGYLVESFKSDQGDRTYRINR